MIKKLISTLARIPFIDSARRHWRVRRDARRVAESWTDEDQRMLEFYSRFLRPGDLCYDIGANIGNRVKIFTKIGARVIAVEPQKDCASVLRQWYSAKGVVVVEKALGEKRGTAELLASNFHMVSSLSPEWIQATQSSGRFAQHRWRSAGQVEIETLDDLLSTWGTPRFAKIDVEGFELSVVKGLSQPLHFLSLEFTPETLESTSECLERLAKLGAEGFNFSDGESMILRFDPWLGLRDMLAFLRGLEVKNEVWGDVYVKFPGGL